MHQQLISKLQILKEFQENHPTSHVGGSIGLMLRGIDLKRDLRKSDLDITIDEYVFDPNNAEQLVPRSDISDFDYGLSRTYANGLYVKMDIRVNPEPSFDVIEFNGTAYNVSKLRDILFWKNKYSDKGVKKHTDDLKTIFTGIRPLEPVRTADIDDLPF